MKIGVLASYRGTMISLDWIDDTDDKKICVGNWEDRACEMISKTIVERKPCRLQVFLFLRWGFWNEYDTLRSHLELIHQHTWLANEIYLVIDRRIGRDLMEETLKASLDEWFEEVGKIHINDILQTDVESITKPDKNTLDKLKGLVSISRKRRDILKKTTTPSNALKYEVYWKFDKLRKFIGEIGKHLTSGISISNAIIIDGEWKHCRSEVHNILNELSGDKFILCTNDIEAELDRYADAHNIELLTFSGFCDLRYFLNLYYLLQSGKAKVANLNDNSYSLPIDGIESDGDVFSKHTISNKKVNLITSAFHPNDFDSYDLNPHTSRILFDLLGDYQENTFVQPIVNTKNLSAILEEMPQDLLIWLHFGHGNKTGLQDASKFFPSIDDWLECFRGKRKSLSLAFFFSCESANIAEEFAKAGVKITIGFEEKLTMEACVELAKVVIPITLNLTGENPEEIAKAFDQRCRSLGLNYLSSCKPRIFYSK